MAFIFFNLALLYGQLNASSFETASTSQFVLATMKSSQFSSATMNGLQSSVMHSDHVKSVMSSLTGQFTASFDSSVSSPSKPTMVQPSEQATSTATPKSTKTTIQPQIPSTTVKMTSDDVLSLKPVTAPTKSRLSTPILVSELPVPETTSYSNSSIFKVQPTLTSSLNSSQSSTTSIMNTISHMVLSPSFTVASQGSSLSSSIPTFIPVNTSSSHAIPYPTSSMKFIQTTSTTVLPNLSSSNVKLTFSISTMNSASISKVVTVISSSLTSNSVVPSVSVTSQSAPSKLYPTSAIQFSYSSVDVSSTLAVKSSCSNEICITLQPSATITQIESRTVLSSSQTKLKSRKTSMFSPSSDSVVSTPSMVHYKPTNGMESIT